MNKLTQILAAATAAVLLPAQAANVIANPGFEAQPLSASWVPYANVGLISASIDQPHSGAYAVLASNRTQSYAGPAQSILGKLTPGVNYTVTAWVRLRAAPTDSNFSLNVKQVDGAGTKYIPIDSLKVDHKRWAKLYGHFKYTPTGSVSTLQFYVTGPAAGIDFYVDDVSFTPPLAYAPPANPAPADFIRAQGRQLVQGAANQPIRLRGTNFSAYDDESSPASVVYDGNVYDAVDFQRVKALGFNTVRLNMWAKVFEDSSAPYIYKPEGWQWLEQTILWARQAGIKLNLTMQAPPGGFQGPGSNTGFWSTPAYQDRLKALWVEIAKRYRNEPVIAGYDILNEPNPPTDATWQAYARSVVSAVRAADPNHLLIVEQSFASDVAPFLVSDSNVMYEFHLYDPWDYSSQLSPKYGRGFYGTYPDSLVSMPAASFTKTYATNAPLPAGTTGWTYYQGQPVPITDAGVYAAVPAFFSSNNAGRVYFDDFLIEEFDPAGQFSRRITAVDVEDAAKLPALWQYAAPMRDPFIATTANWASAATGGSASKRNEAAGHLGTSALSIGPVTGGTYGLINANLQFGVRYGYSYRISGWMKGEAVTGGAGFMGLQLRKRGSGQLPKPLTKAFVETAFRDWSQVDYYVNHNVPFNVGEFGVSYANVAQNLGGLTWLADVLDQIDSRGGNYNYFNYHGTVFGLNTNLYGFPDEATGHTALQNFFKARLALP